jgi:PEP-CTERM motif
MRKLIPALAAVIMATIGASSAAQAALVDFGVAALGGTITYSGGATLDKSSSIDLDGALLVITSTGAGDQSGLSVFPGGPDNTVVLTHPISFGSGTGVVNTPIVGIFKTWTGLVNGVSDAFTETLTTVTEINRVTANALTVTLSGTLTDTEGLFVNTPAQLILSVNQVGGPGATISAAMTNMAAATGAPEPSTWVMMALGFVGLGYAAIRRNSKDRSAVAV